MGIIDKLSSKRELVLTRDDVARCPADALSGFRQQSHTRVTWRTAPNMQEFVRPAPQRRYLW